MGIQQPSKEMKELKIQQTIELYFMPLGFFFNT